jgi:hydrogenase maturation factor
MCLGTVGVIIEVRDDDGVPMALVETDSRDPLSACLLTCPQAAVGETVLVHCGYVLKVLQESS